MGRQPIKQASITTNGGADGMGPFAPFFFKVSGVGIRPSAVPIPETNDVLRAMEELR